MTSSTFAQWCWSSETRREHYDAFLAHVAKENLRGFADPALQYDAIEVKIEDWRTKSFPDDRLHAHGLQMNLFHLVRHLAQTGGQPPPFFPFEHREEHDLTPLAKLAAAEDWGPSWTWQRLEADYHDERRFWRAMFPTFDLFLETNSGSLSKARSNGPPASVEL